MDRSHKQEMAETMAIHRIALVLQVRRIVFVGDRLRCARAAIKETARDLHIRILNLDARPDRIFLVVAAPPKPGLHTLIARFKGATAVRLAKEFPEAIDIPLWTRGYLATTVRQPLACTTGCVRPPHNRRSRPVSNRPPEIEPQ